MLKRGCCAALCSGSCSTAAYLRISKSNDEGSTNRLYVTDSASGLLLFDVQLPRRTEATAPSGTVRSKPPVRGSRSVVS